MINLQWNISHMVKFINITGILAVIEFNCRFLEMDLIKPVFVAVFSVLATCQEDLLRACKKGSQNWASQMRTYSV